MPIPTTNAAGFRAAFPEFQDTVAYPDGSVDFNLVIGRSVTGYEAWGDDMYPVGVYLATAHNLSLSASAGAEAAAGGAPGTARGIVSSESADKASVAFDTTTASEEGAGNWNLTTYGQRWYHFAMIFGAGAIQVGTGDGGGTNVSAYGYGYYGPHF